MPYNPRDRLDEDQLAYIEWRVNPEREGTQRDWLANRGLKDAVINRWRSSPAFMSVYESELRKYGVTYERVAMTLDQLFQKGQKGDTQALTKYLDWANRMLPPQQVETDVSEMSDDELADALRAAADQVQTRAIPV